MKKGEGSVLYSIADLAEETGVKYAIVYTWLYRRMLPEPTGKAPQGRRTYFTENEFRDAVAIVRRLMLGARKEAV